MVCLRMFVGVVLGFCPCLQFGRAFSGTYLCTLCACVLLSLMPEFHCLLPEVSVDVQLFSYAVCCGQVV